MSHACGTEKYRVAIRVSGKISLWDCLFLYVLNGISNSQPPRVSASLPTSQSKAALGTHSLQDALECKLAPCTKAEGKALKKQTPRGQRRHSPLWIILHAL